MEKHMLCVRGHDDGVYGSRERRKELALEPAEGIHALRAVKKMGGFLFYFIFFCMGPTPQAKQCK